MPKQYVKNPDQASDMFMDALYGTGGGTGHVHCNCGIDHYAMGQYYDAFEELPDESSTCIHHDYDFIHYYEVEGKMFVDDCDGCIKYLKRYEDFIWNERDIIRNYLKIRVTQELEWAKHENIMNRLMEDPADFQGKI